MQHVRNLAGINVHAPENDHIVRSSPDVSVPGNGPAAGARPGNDPGQIAGAVADERACLLAQAGDDEFAHLAVRHWFQRAGINDFMIEKIAPVVQPVTLLAVERRAGAVHFGHAADVVTAFQPKLFFE